MLTVTVHGSGGTTGEDESHLRFLLSEGVPRSGHATQLRHSVSGRFFVDLPEASLQFRGRLQATR